MNKKILIIILVVVAIIGAALYIFVFKGEPPIKYTFYSPGEYFVTNVNNSNRLFKISVVLVLDTEELQDQLTEQNSRIRDRIISILRGMDEITLKSLDTEDLLKKQIKDAINQALETEHIVEILFNDYVIQ